MVTTRAGAAILATALAAAACGATPSGALLASGSPGPTAAGTASGDSTPGPPATAWELVVDEPAWGDASLDQIVPGGPGVVALGFGTATVGMGFLQIAAVATPGVPPPPPPSGAVFTSPDGRAWKRAPVRLGFEEGLLASGAGGLVAAGWGFSTEPPFRRWFAWHSDDAESWEQSREPVMPILALTEAGIGFLGIGCESVPEGCLGLVPLSTADGMTFEHQPIVPGSELEAMRGLAAGVQGYLAWGTDWVPECVGVCGPGQLYVWLSDDGATWSAATQLPLRRAGGVFSFSSVVGWETGYVAVGAVGTVNKTTSAPIAAAWISSDGRSWRRTGDGKTFEGGTLSTVLNVGDHLIAAGSVPDGDSTRAALWTSTDGMTWARVPDTEVFGRGRIDGLAVGPSGLVAIGSVASVGVAKPAVWVGPLP